MSRRRLPREVVERYYPHLGALPGSDSAPPSAGVPVEYLVEHLENRGPWCDTCRMPAVFNEHIGHAHSTPERPFGVPRILDDSGHVVTMQEWWSPGRSPGATHRVQSGVADFYEAQAKRIGGDLGDRLKLVADSIRDECR